MSSGPEGHKRGERVWIALAVVAVLVAALGVGVALLPPHSRVKRAVARIGRAVGGLAGQVGRAGKTAGAAAQAVEQGDPLRRRHAILDLREELTDAELVKVYPTLLRALKDEAVPVRDAAATAVGDLSPLVPNSAQAAEAGLAEMLDDATPMLRATAARALGQVARSGRLAMPPPRLAACLDDAAAQVRINAVVGLAAYGKGPELIVPVALRRIPTESSKVRSAFTEAFWQVRLEPSVLPLLIEGLSSDNTDVCLCCTAAINHMGGAAEPALPAILALLRQELEAPRHAGLQGSPDIVGMAAGAIGEIWQGPEPPAGAVELLCEVLRTARLRGPEPASKAQADFRQAEAAWSLGILGRAATSAVPLLLATFASTPTASEHLRGLIAEALAEIARETADVDLVAESLASAWTTASPEQRVVYARALRRLVPDPERFVSEIKDVPPDEGNSQIRRVRYPRPGDEGPVRE